MINCGLRLEFVIRAQLTAVSVLKLRPVGSINCSLCLDKLQSVFSVNYNLCHKIAVYGLY